jgi:TonB family protein
MIEPKPCVRCQRAIDGYARICPYCNWDQGETAPPPQPQLAAAPSYVPSREKPWRRPAITIAGVAALLISAFVVGFFVHGNEPPKNTPKPLSEREEPVQRAPRADVILVPVNEPLEQPITSAPAVNPLEGVPTEYQRSDATAVSSVEYARLAARVQEEKKAQMVDPRSIRGSAYEQTPKRQEEELPVQRPRVLVTSRPVPEYQPLPSIAVEETVTVRLRLTVGADGRVEDIAVLNGVPGQTAKIIQTVQTWRFKPAEENGQPVSAPFSVDLSFKPDD